MILESKPYLNQWLLVIFLYVFNWIVYSGQLKCLTSMHAILATWKKGEGPWSFLFIQSEEGVHVKMHPMAHRSKKDKGKDRITRFLGMVSFLLGILQ